MPPTSIVRSDRVVTDPHRHSRVRKLPLSELAAANRQRDALYQLSEELHLAIDLADVFSAGMDAIESSLDCDRSSVLLFDDAGVMRFVASSGLSEGYRNEVTGHSPWSSDSRDATPIVITDIHTSDLDTELKHTIAAEGIRAAAFIPLMSEGAVIGKFMAYFREPREFSNDDAAVSLTIARQLAFAVQQHRTSERLRLREAELADELDATRLLQQLSIEMAHEPDVDALYTKLVNVARILMRSDFATMQQLIPYLGVNGELKLIAHHGLNEAAVRYWSWVRVDTRSTCGAALLRRERVIAADLENTDFMAGSKELAELLAIGIRAGQTTPLLSRRGELVGMLSTLWKEPHEPSERDLRLMDILARLAADLIERKTQDEELLRREERQRTLIHLLIDVPWQARGDGVFAELQPAWENYTGQSWDAHAGHGWFEAIHPDDRAIVQASWSAACFSAQPYSQDTRIWHAASQEYRRCRLRATPIRNEDGSVREWVGACTEAPPPA